MDEEEKIFFDFKLKEITKLLNELDNNLSVIKGILIFFAILVIIGIIFAACSALGIV
jgi:hypothetical protein